MSPALPSLAISKHVLAPMDLSPAAEGALESAADLARRSAARVTLLNVIDFSGLGDAGAVR